VRIAQSRLKRESNRRVAEASVVYADLGITRGMQYGIDAAEEAGIPVEYRRIAGDA
jgi:hypothetical protein